jgi:HSP20 family molecular chaperone IbpA
MSYFRPWPLMSLDAFEDLFTTDVLKALDKAFPEKKEESFPKCVISTGNATYDGLTIQLALAGYPKENIHVEVGVDFLTVTGDAIKDPDLENLFAARAFSWSRKDPHRRYDFSKTTASFKNGLLTLKVPGVDLDKALKPCKQIAIQ